MNNARTLAIVAVLTAATLVIGLTFAAVTTTTPLAFAAKKVVDPKKGAHDKVRHNGKGNGNTDTDTNLKCKQFGSGFDYSFDQDCEILSNSTINEAAVTPVNASITPEDKGCPAGTLYDVTLDATLTTTEEPIPKGTVLCLTKQTGEQDVTLVIGGTFGGKADVVVEETNQGTCSAPSVHATVTSGDPGPPIGPNGSVCVH